jgi:hypothetical protein
MWLYQPIPLIQEEEGQAGPTTHAGSVTFVGLGVNNSSLTGTLKAISSLVVNTVVFAIPKLNIGSKQELVGIGLSITEASNTISSQTVLNTNIRLNSISRLNIGAKQIIVGDGRLNNNPMIILAGQQQFIGKLVAEYNSKLLIGGVFSVGGAGTIIVNGTAAPLASVQVTFFQTMFESFITGVY